MYEDFLYRDVPALGRRQFRLGLATHFGVEGVDLEWALEQGIDYVFWTPKARQVTKSLKAALKRDRESLTLACGPTTGYFGGGIRRSCERLLKQLGTDYIDIFQIFWLGRTSAWTPSTIDALVSLRESGMVRAIGVSLHDRQRAGKLALDSPLDMLMIRYNAAHRGAETETFPYMKDNGVVSFTATRWGHLLKPGRMPKDEKPLTSSECYRFVLSNPHVHVCLSGPKNREEMKAALHSLENPPLDEAEMERIRRIGDHVHRRGFFF